MEAWERSVWNDVDDLIKSLSKKVNRHTPDSNHWIDDADYCVEAFKGGGVVMTRLARAKAAIADAAREYVLAATAELADARAQDLNRQADKIGGLTYRELIDVIKTTIQQEVKRK